MHRLNGFQAPARVNGHKYVDCQHSEHEAPHRGVNGLPGQPVFRDAAHDEGGGHSADGRDTVHQAQRGIALFVLNVGHEGVAGHIHRAERYAEEKEHQHEYGVGRGDADQQQGQGDEKHGYGESNGLVQPVHHEGKQYDGRRAADVLVHRHQAAAVQTDVVIRHDVAQQRADDVVGHTHEEHRAKHHSGVDVDLLLVDIHIAVPPGCDKKINYITMGRKPTRGNRTYGLMRGRWVTPLLYSIH